MALPAEGVLFRDLKTVRSAGSHTQKGFVPLITLDSHLFLHIFMPSSSFLWAPLCARQGASPQQNTLRKTTWSPALLRLWVRTLASEFIELDPHLMFKSPLKHYQPPQLLIKYLVSAHVGQGGTSFRFWGEGKKKKPSNISYHGPLFLAAAPNPTLKDKWTHLFPRSLTRNTAVVWLWHLPIASVTSS